ncbi:hypothetical protein BH18ACI1_BH18ACI1_20600 [soil metagenome]
MNKGKYVFSQLFDILPGYEFDKCVARYQGDYRVKDFACWLQFVAMSFGQLTTRESLRDTVRCLSAHQQKFCHPGITCAIKPSTLADANENRNWRIYADFAHVLLRLLRHLKKFPSASKNTALPLFVFVSVSTAATIIPL